MPTERLCKRAFKKDEKQYALRYWSKHRRGNISIPEVVEIHSITAPRPKRRTRRAFEIYVIRGRAQLRGGALLVCARFAPTSRLGHS